MSATVFENNLDFEIHLTVNGKLKAVISPGDTIAIDVPPAARVGYSPAGYVTPPQTAFPFSPPAVIPATPAASVPALVRGHGAYRPEAAKAARPVTQYKDGVKVQTLRSVQAASRVAGVQYYEFLKDLRASGDSGYTHDGFCYKYAAPGELPCSPSPSSTASPVAAIGEKRRRNSGKPVVQMALDGTPLRVWPSQSIAADTLGINSSSISKVCHAQWETAGGFRWKLAKAAA